MNWLKKGGNKIKEAKVRGQNEVKEGGGCFKRGSASF